MIILVSRSSLAVPKGPMQTNAALPHEETARTHTLSASSSRGNVVFAAPPPAVDYLVLNTPLRASPMSSAFTSTYRAAPLPVPNQPMLDTPLRANATGFAFRSTYHGVRPVHRRSFSSSRTTAFWKCRTHGG